jgi:hypothetical protein
LRPHAARAADAGGAWFQAALARASLFDALVHTGALESQIAPVLAATRALVSKSPSGRAQRPHHAGIGTARS